MQAKESVVEVLVVVDGQELLIHSRAALSLQPQADRVHSKASSAGVVEVLLQE
jgi:hypothetical protein